MGNRANFGFKDGENTIYLYSHWGGDGMMNTLATAIKVVMDAGRQNDPIYATRIAISNIVGDNWDQGLGYGLTANYISDNEHSIPVVNWEEGTVSLYHRPDCGTPFVQENPKFTMALDIFVKKFLKEISPKPLTYTRV